jgi:hypothetical protein
MLEYLMTRHVIMLDNLIRIDFLQACSGGSVAQPRSMLSWWINAELVEPAEYLLNPSLGP